MPFVIDSSEEDSRCGTFTSQRQPYLQMETPSFLVYTSHATPAHLTADVLGDIKPALTGIQLSLANMFDTFSDDLLSDPEFNLHKFLNLEKYILMLTLTDPLVTPPDDFNTKKDITLHGSNGRSKVTSKEYMKKMSYLKPDVVCAMSDICSHTGKNRTQFSVNRSLTLLDECIEYKKNDETLKDLSLLGVVVGGSSIEQRKRSANETAKRDVDGFLLEGFGSNVSPESFTSLLKICLDELPKEKIKIMHGFGTPETIIHAVNNGIDLFDATYPYIMAEDGNAITFYNKVLSNEPNDEEKSIYKLRRLNLWSFEYSNDGRPLIPGCNCFTCVNHSRAYINHLLATHEMLAEILLLVHNLHHYNEFFGSIREAIKGNLFSQFKEKYFNFYQC